MYLDTFTIRKANSQLESRNPLMVFGSSPQGGHAWIIDGALYKESAICLDPNKPKTYYYHCVWGWGGKDNGYFTFPNKFSVEGYIFENMGYVANLQKDN